MYLDVNCLSRPCYLVFGQYFEYKRNQVNHNGFISPVAPEASVLMQEVVLILNNNDRDNHMMMEFLFHTSINQL